LSIRNEISLFSRQLVVKKENYYKNPFTSCYLLIIFLIYALCLNKNPCSWTVSSSHLPLFYSKNVLKRLYYDYYFVRQENLWRQNALKTLPVLLNSSDMLACGEDLGLLPACVHPV
jgi:hypothetical protein